MAPLDAALRTQGLLRPVLVATGQHETMFHQGLAAFETKPDVDLRIGRRSGTQAELASKLVQRLDDEFVGASPSAVVVQGDTSSALVAALAAFWRQIRIVHLEAGLRSHDLTAPFPEEANRRLIGQLADLHLAPTPAAAVNLRAEGVADDRIEVIGNTVVDALLAVADRHEEFGEPRLRRLEERRGRARIVLVTVHRRESWGARLRGVLAAVRDILDRHRDVMVVLPTHPNPAVRADVEDILGGDPRVLTTEPLDYPDLVGVLRQATLVLSDSGGIQEEAPTFGVPVLVLRDRTERLEAVEAGCAILVGTDRDRIVATADRLLADDAARRAMVANGNPFGDGRAGDRAATALAALLGLPVEPMTSFRPTPALAG